MIKNSWISIKAGIEPEYWIGKDNTAFFKNSAQPGECWRPPATSPTRNISGCWPVHVAGPARRASKAHAIALLEGGLSLKLIRPWISGAGLGREFLAIFMS
jgi:hypothetical protein